MCQPEVFSHSVFFFFFGLHFRVYVDVCVCTGAGVEGGEWQIAGCVCPVTHLLTVIQSSLTAAGKSPHSAYSAQHRGWCLCEFVSFNSPMSRKTIHAYLRQLWSQKL